MNYASCFAAQGELETARLITVETDISHGLHSFTLVGLPDKAVEEARDRVSAAIKNSGYTSPKTTNQKVTISLAPADLRKEGSSFDVAIALSYLHASGQIDFDHHGKVFLGELSLRGDVLPVKGILAVTRHLKSLGVHEIFVAKENEKEAALVKNITVYGVRNLSEITKHLDKKIKEEVRESIIPTPPQEFVEREASDHTDFSLIKGQDSAKRALLIAAAGGHNIALYGPPGTGKTLLARAFASLLPPLEEEEAFEVTSIHSLAGTLKESLVKEPPFRSPHHSSSSVAIIGGGGIIKPGEITLAHRGVLFLDEFPEFDKKVLESLREPLEEGKISLSRARGKALFPAQFILIAAMNPCPCGFYGSDQKKCFCSGYDIEKYKRKLSGPIMDRIDMFVPVSLIPYEDISGGRQKPPESPLLRKKVMKARQKQRERLGARRENLNAHIAGKDVEKFIPLSPSVKTVLDEASKKLQISPRSYFKMIKLARTIADLEGNPEVESKHILEAFSYRPKIEY